MNYILIVIASYLLIIELKEMISDGGFKSHIFFYLLKIGFLLILFNLSIGVGKTIIERFCKRVDEYLNTSESLIKERNKPCVETEREKRLSKKIRIRSRSRDNTNPHQFTSLRRCQIETHNEKQSGYRKDELNDSQLRK